MFTVQNGTEKIRIPIDHEHAGKLLARIIANTPTQETYLHSLTGFHKYNEANETIQKAQNKKLMKVVAKKKSNTKKTIGSSHYDKDVRDTINHKN